MKRILLVLPIFLLASCGWFADEEVENQVNALRDKSSQVLEQGKDTADEIKAKSEAVRDQVKTKVEDVDAAFQEIKEAEEAVSRVFGSRYEIDMEREKSDLCLTDDECIVVEYEGCCSKVRAINKTYLERYNTTATWQKDDTDCSQVVCEDLSAYTQTACRPDHMGAQRCVLTKPE